MAPAFSIDGEPATIEILRRRPRLVLRIGRREYEVAEEAGSRPRLRIDGEPIDFVFARERDVGFVRLGSKSWTVRLIDPRQSAGSLGDGVDEIRAPMPGVVVSVNKAKGDQVRRGEAIVTIESMKLQMALAAPRDGIIATLNKKPEETVGRDEIVATLLAVGEA